MARKISRRRFVLLSGAAVGALAVGYVMLKDDEDTRLVFQKTAAGGEVALNAWLKIDADGMVTEGTHSNAWIVSEDGELITRQPDNAILDGITRRTLLDMAQGDGITFKVRPFSAAEALAAREAFLTSSSSFVKPVIRIDGQDIGGGKTGPLTRKLIGLYANYLETLGPPS